jgi:hypothetical protein
MSLAERNFTTDPVPSPRLRGGESKVKVSQLSVQVAIRLGRLGQPRQNSPPAAGGPGGNAAPLGGTFRGYFSAADRKKIEIAGRPWHDTRPRTSRRTVAARQRDRAECVRDFARGSEARFVWDATVDPIQEAGEHMTTRRVIAVVVAVVMAPFVAGPISAQQPQTIITDADAGVREVCRWDVSEEDCLVPRGGDHEILDPWNDDPAYLRVHDQNAMDVAYLHFDLSSVADGAQVSEARFQLDLQSNSWGDTSVMVVAIVNENEDWDLDEIPENEIFGGNAPKLEWSDWEDDPTPDSNRYNFPTPFIDEGNNPADDVRQLVDEFEPVFIASTDSQTTGTIDDPGNSYGGYACCDVGDGGDGSSDSGDNPWPLKNAIDIDVTPLIQWKLGQNAAYSEFEATDRELTLMVRTELPEAGGSNGFARFIAKESPFLDGEFDLQPGRLVLSVEGGGLVGDFNANGVLDGPDIDDLTTQSAGGLHPASHDLNADAMVNDVDVRVWIKDLFNSWVGDADLNGEFNSGDLVAVLASGTYEVEVDSVWTTGDFNGDGRTNSGDLVAALSDGGYELGPRAAVASVPEPSAILLTLCGVLMIWVRRYRR